jgi:hypothetical protein
VEREGEEGEIYLSREIESFQDLQDNPLVSRASNTGFPPGSFRTLWSEIREGALTYSQPFS